MQMIKGPHRLLSLALLVWILLVQQKAFADPWTPPIGIPAPSFGIEELHTIYAGQIFAVGGFPYRDAGNGPYTHYIDNSVACSDSGNPYGTDTSPRCSIPSNLPAGSVVEIHGGPYYLGNPPTFTGNGTVSLPVFLRGPGTGGKAQLIHASDAKLFEGSYFIVENIDIDRGRTAGDHIAIRNSEVHDHPYRNAVSVGGQHIVIYNNHIHHTGNQVVPDDRHGVWAGPSAEHVWIVDNEINNCSGDGVQFCHACPEPGPQYVYIGRNTISDNVENAVDFKTSRHVVVSQNEMYGHTPTSSGTTGSDGTAALIGSNGLRDAAVNIWIIFNDIHDNEIGIRVEASANVDETSGPAYLIGNLIRHSPKSAIVFEKSGNPIHIYGNTVYDTDTAVNAYWRDQFVLYIHNNIFANLRGREFGNHVNIEPSVVAQNSIMSQNLFWQNGNSIIITWGGTYTYNSTAELAGFPGGANNILSDPKFNNPGTDFHLQSDSPAVDSGNYNLYDYAATFCATFGAFIPDCENTMKVDIEKNVRPHGSAWDMGAFEYTPGGPDTNPPAAPTGLHVK
jgi:hypothetical protein